MTKITDLEADLTHHKAEATERMTQLEKSMEAMSADSDKRHAEIMALLLAQSKPPPPPFTAQVTAPIRTPLSSAPASQIPVSQPFLVHASGLVFDANDLPIQPDFGEGSADYNPYTFRTSHEIPFPPPPGTSRVLSDTGPPPFGGHLVRGSGPINERVWLPGSDHRLRKLKMPIIDGEDAYGWVYRLERYFDIQGFVTIGEKLRAAVLCMEGQALAWYRWSESRATFRHWDELKHRLLERFQPSQEGDVYEQFLAIKQEGTARDYIGQFETLAAQIPGLQEKVMEGTFVKGLKPDLRASVRQLQLVGLSQII